MSDEDATPREGDPYAGRLNRKGGKPGRKSPVYKVFCPACGAGPMASNAVTRHLMGKKCARVHTKAEAQALAKEAPRDPEPYRRAVAQAEAWIEEWQKRRDDLAANQDGSKKDAVLLKNADETLEVMRQQLERILLMGIKKYVPPPGYYSDDE